MPEWQKLFIDIHTSMVDKWRNFGDTIIKGVAAIGNNGGQKMREYIDKTVLNNTIEYLLAFEERVYRHEEEGKDVIFGMGVKAGIMHVQEIINSLKSPEAITKLELEEILDYWENEFGECEYVFNNLREDLINSEGKSKITEDIAEILRMRDDESRD